MRPSLPIKITLPDCFFWQIENCGYTVTSKQKKVWAVQLDLYHEFARICEKYNLKYQICFGTLLGAVRHKGFIPWDYDFDVCMRREDVNKLISLTDEFQYPYFLQTPLSDRRYACPLTRLRNSETTAAISGYDTPDYNNGIYIDVYALDGLSKSKAKNGLQYILKRLSYKLWTLSGQSAPRRNTLRERLMYLFKPVARVFTYEKWYSIYLSTLTMWEKSSNILSHMVTSTWSGKKNWITKDEFDDTVEMEFEGVKVPAPRNYDAILRREYGDYMKLPPFDERGFCPYGSIHFDPDLRYKDFLIKAGANDE